MEPLVEEYTVDENNSGSSSDILNIKKIYLSEMSKVLPGLYVGNYRDSKDPQQLDRYNITHIIAIHDSPRRLLPDKHYLCVMAADTPDQNLSQYFPVCNDFIHAARLREGNVLIHCLAGMSRSVTVAVAYIMSVTQLSWKEALKVVRAGRAVANPNLGFQTQLQDFELYKLPEERKRLKERFPSIALSHSDRDQCGLALNNYEELLSNKDICEGNCVKGQDCPTGMCRTDPTKGIFRRKTSSASIRSASRLTPGTKTSQSCPTSPRYNSSDGSNINSSNSSGGGRPSSATSRPHRGSRIDENPGTSTSLNSSPAGQRRHSELKAAHISEMKIGTNINSNNSNKNISSNGSSRQNENIQTNSRKDTNKNESCNLHRSSSTVSTYKGAAYSNPTGFCSYTGSAPPSVHGSRVDLSGPTNDTGSAIYLGFNPAGRNSYVGATWPTSKGSIGGSAPPTPVHTPPVSPKRGSKRINVKK